MTVFSSRRFVLGAFGTAALALVGACATPSGPAFDATSLPPVAPGQSRVIFYEPASWTLPNIWRRVEINGQQFGEIGMGEFMVLDVAPGRQHVRLWRASRTAGGPGEQFVRDAEVLPGATLYVRYINRAGSNGGSGILISSILDQVPEPLALKDLVGLKQAQIGATHTKAS